VLVACATPATALAGLPDVTVVRTSAAGAPSFVQGRLGQIALAALATPEATDQALRPALAPALTSFGLRAADLRLQRVHTDPRGGRHLRYQQQIDGLDVIGGDVLVHLDATGVITAMNGKGRPASAKLAIAPTLSPAQAVERLRADPRFADLRPATPRLVYITTTDGATFKAYETVVSGERATGPVEDKVYVDVASGAIVADYPQIKSAETRSVYDAGHGSNLPGTLKRSEGGPATSDADVNGAYDLTGATYEAYASFWGRDSYDNAGGPLKSTVHYQNKLCNAFWNPTLQQMLFGDGDDHGCGPLARSADVIGHELTHAVTEHESGLVYAHESGGINESLSDIFGNFVEAWIRGGKDGDLAVTDATFLVGEDVLPPALRFMCDPARDLFSKDFWTPDLGDADVHSSSGVGNLAFCLMARGGIHPGSRTSTIVPALGLDRTMRIFYEAQINWLNSTSDYHDLRTAMQSAAAALGYDRRRSTRSAAPTPRSASATSRPTAPATCPRPRVASPVTSTATARPTSWRSTTTAARKPVCGSSPAPPVPATRPRRRTASGARRASTPTAPRWRQATSTATARPTCSRSSTTATTRRASSSSRAPRPSATRRPAPRRCGSRPEATASTCGARRSPRATTITTARTT
jgi:vibriolysin